MPPHIGIYNYNVCSLTLKIAIGRFFYTIEVLEGKQKILITSYIWLVYNVQICAL